MGSFPAKAIFPWDLIPFGKILSLLLALGALLRRIQFLSKCSETKKIWFGWFSIFTTTRYPLKETNFTEELEMNLILLLWGHHGFASFKRGSFTGSCWTSSPMPTRRCYSSRRRRRRKLWPTPLLLPMGLLRQTTSLRMPANTSLYRTKK